MRNPLRLAGVLLLLAPGCSRISSAPAPVDPAPSAGSAAVSAAPATVVLSGVTDGHRHLLAVGQLDLWTVCVVGHRSSVSEWRR